MHLRALASIAVVLGTTGCVSRDLAPERFGCGFGGPCAGDAAPASDGGAPADALSAPDALVAAVDAAELDGSPPEPDATTPELDGGGPDAAPPQLDAGTDAGADGGIDAGPWWRGSARVPLAITASAALSAGDALDVVVDHAAWVAAGLARADGQDLRVVRWDGSQWEEQDRVLDPGSAWGDAATRLWIAAPADLAPDATDDSLFVYFGDPTAGPAPADPARVFLFHDDFETGTTAAWDATRQNNGALDLQQSEAHRGLYALRSQVGLGNGWASLELVGRTWTSAITTLWLRIPPGYGARDSIAAFYCAPACTFGAPFGQIGGVRLSADQPVLMSYATDGTQTTRAARDRLTATDWHRVELRTRAHPTAGRSELWVDGARQATLTGLDTRTQLQRLDVGLFWKADTATTATVFTDDVFVRTWVDPPPVVSTGGLQQR